MDNDTFFKDYHPFVAFRDDRYGKSTLFESDHILVGLNCLKPGQEMGKHAHEAQWRFYVVLEGHGQVGVGDQLDEAETGMVIWVPPGYTHRINNTGGECLVLLVGIASSRAD